MVVKLQTEITNRLHAIFAPQSKTNQHVRKTLANLFWRPVVSWYIRKPRLYRFRGLTLRIEPGVFHPAFFFSTRYVVAFMDSRKNDFAGKTFLEPGAGSGLISFVAAQYGAVVTASDLNKTAVATLKKNAETNQLPVHVIHSDLFREIPLQQFDYIVINPPYFKKNPANDAELAWYCGENMEYFKKLFASLRPYLKESSECLMVLADNCDLAGIQQIAAENDFRMTEIHRKKISWEINFIFRIDPVKK